MNETPQPPLPPPPAGGLPVPPYGAPSTLPPGTPAGRPRIWQAVLLFLAFGGLAAGSCAAYVNRPNAPGAELWSLLFVFSLPFGAAAFALLVFRLWRRRAAEAWPGLGQAMLMVFAGGLLAAGGCGGWVMTMEATALWPIAMALGGLFILGLALSVGAGELFVVGIFRLIFKRPGAR